MWRELCSKTREKLTDPYLRAAFAFLTSDTESHEAVLVRTFKCSYICIGFLKYCFFFRMKTVYH